MAKNSLLPHSLLVTPLFALPLQANTEAPSPNIILFLVDDMGWQDTSVPFHNNIQTDLNKRFHTPNMERLAQMGVRFSQGYSCAVSSPTRCSLLSGMNAARHRVTNWTLRYNQRTDRQSDILSLPNWHYNGIQPDTITDEHSKQNATLVTALPRILQQHGYYTIHCGKAHFAAETTAGENPLSFGFDVNIGGGANGAPGSYLGTKNFGAGTRFAVKGLEEFWGQDIFLSEALTLKAIEAIQKPISENKPFFLYMSHYAVHTPYDEDKRFSGNYRGVYDLQLKDTLNNNEVKYAALIEGMDKSLGDILNYLEAHPQVAENTIILFTSDNGGQALNNVRQGTANRDQNYPARAGKGSAFMGGVREPMMVYWKGVTTPGSINHNPVMVEDFYPTILEMAGIQKYNTTQVIDGKSFVPALKTPQKRHKRPIVWHYPNLWGETQDKEEGYGAYSAYLDGNYHLIYTWETQQLRLYNIAEDIAQQNDLASTHPKLVKKLANDLTKELKKMDAQRPALKATGELIPYPNGASK